MPPRITPSDDLLRRFEALAETYARLSHALAQAARDVESGSLPDASLLIEVASSREAFHVLVKDALAAADGLGVAMGYATNRGTNSSGKGLVMRMSLKSDARTITLDHLESLARQAVARATKEEQNARSNGDKKALERADLTKWLGSGRDNGASRFAVAMGYDAISIPQHGQWIILNRTALRISHQVRA